MPWGLHRVERDRRTPQARDPKGTVLGCEIRDNQIVEVVMQRLIIRCLCVFIVGGTITACASAPSPLNRVALAYATFSDANGDQRGTAQLWQDLDKIVHVELQVTGL